MKNLQSLNCIQLTKVQSQSITGGGETVKTTIWQDVAFIGCAIARGFNSLISEGGKNSSHSVK